MGEDLGVSPLTLAEMLVGPVRAGRLRVAEQMLHDIEVTELPCPPDAAPRLAQLRVDYSLRLPDCCVLPAAEEASALVATFDAQLNAAATNRNIGIYNA